MRRARNSAATQFTTNPVPRPRTEHEALRDAVYALSNILPDIDFAQSAIPSAARGTYFAAIPADIRRYIFAPLVPYRKTKEWMIATMAAESVTRADLDALCNITSPPMRYIRALYIGEYTIFRSDVRVFILRNNEIIYDANVDWCSGDMYYFGNNIVCLCSSPSGIRCIDLENPRRYVESRVSNTSNISLLPCGLLLCNNTRRLHNIRTGQSRELPELREIGNRTELYKQTYVDDYGCTFQLPKELTSTKSPLRCVALLGA